MDTLNIRRAAAADEKSFPELEASLEKAGRVEELIRLYESRVRDVAATDAANVLARAGELARDRQKNPGRAEELFRRALLMDPTARKPLLGLKALYEQRQDHAALAEILERLAGHFTGEESAALYLRAADLFEQKLGRKDRAILAVQHATRANPKDRQAFRRLRTLFATEGRHQSVLDVMLHERQGLGDAGAPDELVGFAEKLVEDPTEHALAHRALHLALELDPKNARAPLTQKALQKFEHAWRNRAQQLRAQSFEERDRKAAARYSLAVARLHAWYDGGGGAKLKEALDRCFVLWPAMPEALELIERIAERNNDHPAAVAQLEKLAEEAKDRTAQGDLWVRAGMLRITRLRDAEGARAAFERAAAGDPSRADAVGLASELLLEGGHFEEAVALLERHLPTVKDRGHQLSVLLRLADLCHAQLRDDARARRHLAAALKLDPANASAAFQAAQLAVGDEELDGISALIDLAVHAPRPLSERVALCEAAGLALDEAGKHKEAFHILARALQLQPTRPMLLSSVVEQAEQAGAQLELAEALLRAARVAPDAAAIELWKNLAQLLQDPLARPDDAAAAWQEVLRRAPQDPAALAALQGLNGAVTTSKVALAPPPAHAPPAAVAAPPRAAGTPAEPIPLTTPLRRPAANVVVEPQDPVVEMDFAPPAAPPAPEADLVTTQRVSNPLGAQRALDPKAQLELEAKRLEGSAADPAQAADVSRRILALAPDDVSALKRLGAACAAMAQWDEVARVTARLAELSPAPEEKREWRARLAQLFAERLGRKDDAAALYLALLSEGDTSAAVIGGLERLASSGVQQAQISVALAPYYAQSGDYQRQVGSLLVQLSTAQDRNEKKKLLALLARTHEQHLADSRAALDCCLRALAVDPADPHFRGEAIRLARDLSAHVELARVLSDLASKSTDRTLSTALLQESAELAEEAGAIDDAAAALNAALDQSPDDPGVLHALVQLYFRADRFSDCDQVLRRRILVADNAEKAQLYLKLAELSAELKRPREASQAVQEAIKAGADELTHLPRLCELLEKAGRMVELSSALGRWIELSEKKGDKELASRLSLRRAQVLEASLGDRAEALKNYSSILAKRPSDPDALAALDVLLKDPAIREEAARVLVPAYEATKEHRKLVGALEIIAEAAQDPLERMLALKQAAYVHLNHLRQPELAFAALARAVRYAPNDGNLRNIARQAAEQADALDSYAEVLAELVDAQQPQARVAIHRELAGLYENLGSRVEAIQHLRAAHALDPKGIDVLKALQRLHRAGDEWAALAEALEALARVVPEPAEKLALWREAANLHEQRLHDAESAAGCWRQIAERDPLDREAASALDRLYTALDRPRELAFALELRRAQEGQSPQGRELAFRLAQLRKLRLEDGAGALNLFRQILAEDPGHAGTLEALDGWARSGTVDGGAALELLDAALVQVADHARRIVLREARMNGAPPAERARLAAEIRAIYERDLNQPERAFLAALRAFAEGVDRDEGLPDLERLALQTGNFEELAEVYENVAQDRADEASIRLLRRAAELREQLGQTELAIRLWGEVQARAPQDRQALDSLGRLYERSQNAKNLSEVYARQAQLAQDPAERHALLLKAGAAYEAAGNDLPAIDAFKAANAIRISEEGLSALDRLYGKAHRSEEQADVLDQLATLAAEPTEKRAYLLRRAQLLEKEGSAGEAVNAFARVLGLSPQDPQAIAGIERLLSHEKVQHEAARLLEPIYRSLNDARKLVDVLELRLPQISDAKRVELLVEIAQLREALGEKAQAFGRYLRAFVEQPASPEIREALERLAAETGSFEELAGSYEDQLERGLPDALTLDLWRRVAVLYGERLNRPDLAARAWTEVARRDAQDARALDALAAIYRKGGAFKELAAIMKRQVGLEKNPAAQVQILFELARLAEDTLSDKALAAQCYQAIIVRKPDDRNAIKFLGRVLADMEKWPELATLLGRELQLAEAQGAAEEALELMVRLGRLRLARLNDPRGALDTFQAVLAKKAGHAGAVGALEEMARSENPLRGEAAEALEPVFATQGDHQKRIQMLEQRVSAEPVAAERAQLLRAMAELYAGALANPEMAFLSATRALREAPDDDDSLALCLRLAGPAGAEEELIGVLEESATKAVEDRSRVALYRALGRFKAQHQDPQGAQDAWRRVLEHLPQDPEALEQLSGLLAAGNTPGELMEVLSRRLSQAEATADRVALLRQIGDLQAGAQDDTFSALATYRALLELAPQDVGALEAMERACEKQERWPELADVLARRIALLPSAQALEEKLRLAVLREEQLYDRVGAVALYTELLAEKPDHPGAIARVEALLAADPASKELADVLLRAFRASGDAEKLTAAIEARVGVSPDAFERKDLLVEVGTLRETQDQPEMGFMAFFRAFKEDPNDATLRARLEKLADTAEAYDELVAVYEEELPLIAEAKDAAQVHLKLAQVLDTRLDEPERAIGFYEKARELDPELAPKALPALERLYAKLEQPQPHARTLEAMAEAATEPADKVGLLFKLGQLCAERLQDPARAAEAFEKVLAVDRTHLASARLLEQLYETSGATDKLYAVLKHQRDLVSGAERERVLSKMAHVSAEGLSDVGHSIDLYRELLAKNPRNEQAFASLEGLLERARRYDELRELLQKKLAATLDPRELVKLNDRLGRVIFRLQEKPEEAIPFYRAALDRDARHKNALEALREIYDQTGRKDDLVAVLRRLIPLQDNPVGVKAVRLRLAEVLAELGRREEALDAARRALEVEPHEVAELDRVHRTFIGLRAFNEAVRTLELKAHVQLGQELREDAITTLFQVVELWKGDGGRPESAGPALEKILELDPANRRAYEQAVELYAQVNDWRAYATAVNRYLPNLVTDEEKIAAMRDLASVQEHKLGQKELAFMAICRALQLNPAEPTAREEAERLAEEAGAYEELASVYEDVADNLPRGPLAEQLYLKLATFQDQKLDDPGAAEAALRKILEFDPTNAVALDRLGDIFSRRGQFREYVLALEQKLESAGSIEQRKAILREIAQVQDVQAKDPEEAAAALLRALELEPDAETLGALITLYRREKKWPEAAGALLRLRDLAQSPVEAAKLQYDVGLLYEREVGDDEAAIQAYLQTLEFDGGNADALSALDRLYTKHDRASDLLSVYERQLEMTQDWREKVSVLFKSAAIWEDRYQNLENAGACMEAVLQYEPQNLQAIRALERIRRAEEKWDGLVSALEAHAALAESTEERARLLVEIGDVFHQHLKLADRAVASYSHALEIDPSCRPSMHALGNLYERSGNWPDALQMLWSEAQAAGHSPDAVELFQRIGKINEEMLLDTAAARSAYEQALAIDQGYLPAIRALKGIHQQSQDWTAYEKALVQEAENTEDPEAKGKAYLDVAKYHAETRDDREAATPWFEAALKLLPQSVEAARPLADVYVGREDWAAAERMLDVVAASALEPKELCRQLYRLGYVSEKLGKKDKALSAYERAYQLDATYLPALEGLGNLLVQVKRFDEALKVYQSILIHHREELTDLEVVEVYWQIGDIHNQLKQPDRAQNHFEKALAIDPGHEPSLRALMGLADAAKRWDKSAEYRQALVQALEGDAKFAMYVELGILARDLIKDPYMAIDAYVGAHRMRPEALDVMDALYALYRETKQGKVASEILEKMLAQPELAKHPSKAKRVQMALGEISRDETKDLTRAAEAFNAALDLDPKFIEAFSALEAMLGGAKEWKQLEENYARMIQRLPKTEETHAARMALWKALGDLYLKVLRHTEGALMAYQVAAAGMQDDPQVQETYALLAAQAPGHEDKAMAAFRRAVPKTADLGKVVSAMAELSARRKDYDAAYLAAQVANVFVGHVGEAEKEILAKLSPYAKRSEVAQRALPETAWRQHLLHPSIRGPVAEVMALLFTQAGHLYAQPMSQYQIHPKKHRIDVASAQEYQIHHFRYVARVLGMEAFELYSPFLVATRERMAKRSSDPAPDPLVSVELCQTHPPALRVGGKFFGEPGQREVYYLLGRTLALLRPELALTQRVAPERLQAIFEAAISLSVPGYRFTVHPQALDAERAVLVKAMPEPARAQLSRAVAEYVRRGPHLDMKAYLEAAELTAARTGLFVAGELEAAKKMATAESGVAFRVSPKAKLRELVTFALSEDLAALRAAVGTNVEVQVRK